MKEYSTSLVCVITGDGVCDEGVRVDTGAGLSVCQAEAFVHQAQRWLHEATHHLPGHPGRQVCQLSHFSCIHTYRITTI